MAFIPNTTPTPNWLYNGEMRKMNETELKVVLLVTRKTLGWFDPMTQERKTQDYISQSQFMEFTGQSHTAIASAIQVAVENGWIIARNRKGEICDTSDKRRRNKILYQLGNVFTSKISKQQSGLDENLSNKVAQSKQHLDTNLSNKVDNTKVTLTKVTNTKDTAETAEWDFLKELEKLKTEKRKDLRLVAFYWKIKNWNFENKEQFSSALKRELRPAKNLIGYTGQQIGKAMTHCQKNYKEWTLESVHKAISRTINNTK